MMKKVIHLIPFDAHGGVETAVLSMRDVTTSDMEFDVRVLFPGELTAQLRRKSFNLFSLLSAGIRIAARPPDVLIVSLWRAAIVGIICKLLQSKTKLVVFLHCAHRVHLADHWVTALAMRLASEIWSDSATTIDATAPGSLRAKCHVISYIPRKFEPVTSLTPGPNFVFWGRLARQKNLSRAIRLFVAVHDKRPEATFKIIGPEGGEGPVLRRLCRDLGVEDAVSFVGSKSQNELSEYARAASFFLLTSDFEGLGLAVAEAMQMGLIPVVTRVGEVGVFCNDGINAIVFDSDIEAVEKILAVIESPKVFRNLRENSRNTWSDRPSYRDDVLAACDRITMSTLSTSPKIGH